MSKRTPACMSRRATSETKVGHSPSVCPRRGRRGRRRSGASSASQRRPASRARRSMTVRHLFPPSWPRGPIPSIGRKNSASLGNCSFDAGHAWLDIRIPTIPQHAAGDRMDPPKSPPQSNAAIPRRDRSRSLPGAPRPCGSGRTGCSSRRRGGSRSPSRKRQGPGMFGLAEEDRSGSREDAVDRSRLARDALAMPPGSPGRDDAGRVPGVLEDVWDAVEGRVRLRVRVALRLVEHAEERAHLSVVRVDRATTLLDAVAR